MDCENEKRALDVNVREGAAMTPADLSSAGSPQTRPEAKWFSRIFTGDPKQISKNSDQLQVSGS